MSLTNATAGTAHRMSPLEQTHLLEEQHRVYRYAHDGVAAWRIMRGLFLERHEVMSNPHHIPPRPLSTRLRDVLRSLGHAWRDIRLLDRIAPGCPVLLLSYANRHTQEKGRRTDLLGDPLLQAVGDGVKVVAPFPPPETLAMDGIRAMLGTSIPALTTSAGIRLRPPGRDLRLIAAELARLMRNISGLEIFCTEEVAHILRCVEIQRAVYRRMLRRIMPGRVVVTNTQEWSLSAAAHDLGIPVFEMQHGLFTRTHPDMLLAPAVEWGDSVLPRAGFLLFGDYWKSRLTGGGYYADDVFHCVGNSTIESSRRAIHSGTSQTIDTPHIIRVLWTLSGNETPVEFSFIAEALRVVVAKTPTVLTIRIHPRYHTPTLMGLAEGLRGVATRITTPAMHVPVHEELLRCHVHISSFSTCHFDALGMGRPTVVLPFKGHEHVADLVDMGYAPLASSPASLADVILAVPPRSTHEQAYRFCTPGYQGNIRRALAL